MKAAHAATVFGCAAVLLAYPEDSFTDDLRSVTEAVNGLPHGRARASLSSATRWLSGMQPGEAASAYVDTFDLHRGITLHVTWYSHGDTRERGTVLAALTDTYRAGGYELAPGELPDFLPALLELAAVHPPAATVLREQRPAVEALRLGLEEAGSGYAPVVEAVIAALPSPSRADRDALARFMAQGPPSEAVGLEPYGPPELLGQRAGRR